MQLIQLMNEFCNDIWYKKTRMARLLKSEKNVLKSHFNTVHDRVISTD